MFLYSSLRIQPHAFYPTRFNKQNFVLVRTVSNPHRHTASLHREQKQDTCTQLAIGFYQTDGGELVQFIPKLFGFDYQFATQGTRQSRRDNTGPDQASTKLPSDSLSARVGTQATFKFSQ
mmetsp:Transcript_11997/g.50116  ORF Transcript_11997/g.50116 Transcript_11997/m.50116 type:complete len:120 (-) Transcript_11997:107-466(-)